MSRTLLVCLTLLGFGFISCSSSPSTTPLGVDSRVATTKISPHPHGLSTLGSGIGKYWLGQEKDSPYAKENSERGFLSLFTDFGHAFGNSTKNTWHPQTTLFNNADKGMTMSNWFLNYNSHDPYND